MRVKCAAEAEVFQGWWHHFIRAWLALSVCPSAKSSNRPNEGEGRKGSEEEVSVSRPMDGTTQRPNAAKTPHLTAHLLFSVHDAPFFMSAPIKEYFKDAPDMI